MESTLKSLCRKVRMSVDYSGKPCPWENGRDFNSWKIQLRYAGRKMTVDFFTGPALGEPREVSEVLDCLLSDSMAGDSSFEDFCAECGFDTDSRKAERTWKACQKCSTQLHRFLGSDYEEFLYSDRN